MSCRRFDISAEISGPSILPFLRGACFIHIIIAKVGFRSVFMLTSMYFVEISVLLRAGVLYRLCIEVTGKIKAWTTAISRRVMSTAILKRFTHRALSFRMQIPALSQNSTCEIIRGRWDAIWRALWNIDQEKKIAGDVDLHIWNMSYAYAAGSNAFLFPRCTLFYIAHAFSAFAKQPVKLHAHGRRTVSFALHASLILTLLYLLWIFSAW